MGRLRFSGGVSAEHDGPFGSVSDGNELGPANGSDHELSAGGNCRATGFGIEDGADADKGALANFLPGIANGGDGIRGSHGDFDGDDPAADEGFGKRGDLFGVLGANHGDNARVRKARDDFRFARHRR